MLKKIVLLPILIFIICLIPLTTSALTLSPPTQELLVKPGQTEDFKIKLFNEEDHPVYLQANLKKFVAQGLTGQPKLLSIDNNDQFTSWFWWPGQYTKLEPGELQEITLSVTVPKEALPAEYYPVLAWQTLAGPGETKALGVSAEVATLIFLQVQGEKIEKLSLVNFNPVPAKKVYWQRPRQFLVAVKNEGNVHLTPSGIIKISGLGQATPLVLAVNEVAGRVLPGSERIFVVSWPQTGRGIMGWFKNNFGIGQYGAELNLFFGQEPQTIGRSISFWVIAWPAVVLILLVIGFLFSLFF